MKNRSNSSQIRQYLLFEIPAIILAVLLALGLDTWQGNKKREKMVNGALMDIGFEISNTFLANAATIDDNKKYLEALRTGITEFRKSGVPNFAFSVARPEFNNLAWQSAKENDLSRDFERALFLDIAFVYEEQRRLTALIDYWSEFELKSDPGMDPFILAQHKERQLSNIVFRSEELIKKAKWFRDKYEKHPMIRPLDDLNP